ncbi:protein DMR6-LIKE OXYGENASE 2 [Dendrobium catenatum]|uniref:Flavonol synthase/flavanone 3-hydroxylase n=1 Tax=Dendrobium catenatum TaxID=906689 RepID=A0A2I0VTW7_9ASPA|nr:protein DMR6-LIKE OXYGENASE 2 [Dendrobium catenatum]PKU66857.1 Flavonol synthase/flavanone 3-hydroxylase [Dendrobium catenatum]
MAASSSFKFLLADFASDSPFIPSNYIRPAGDRPELDGVENSGEAIPVIDLSGLNGPHRHKVVTEIGMACKNAGFFKVKKHGIPKEVLHRMLDASKAFFLLPESVRLKNYSDDPTKSTRLSTSFNIATEKLPSWRDYLRLHCHPIEAFINEWPSQPPSFKPAAADYASHVRRLALRLLSAISESLSLKSGYLESALGRHAQHMAINYYPQCPQPELTYGLPAHKDPNVITILMQDGVTGLQVMRDGKWVAVEAEAGELVVNVGDQLQVLSNGRYTSVLHRAVVNKDIERLSVPTFYCPGPETVVEAAEELVDEEHPRLYKKFTYGDYSEKFWKGGLRMESCLDLFRESE